MAGAAAARRTFSRAWGNRVIRAALQAIDRRPAADLPCSGRRMCWQGRAVALVGSRNASAAGLKFAARLARELGEAGFAVVSGLARGIDTAAHEASLDSGTIAVLAGGLERDLSAAEPAAASSGCWSRVQRLSEMPLGWVPAWPRFPAPQPPRVSGLSLGTVVVEAARKSGSLITARFANEQGRLVFAVPGSPLDPRAEGGNHLIREGATLCADASPYHRGADAAHRRRPGHSASRCAALGRCGGRGGAALGRARPARYRPGAKGARTRF